MKAWVFKYLEKAEVLIGTKTITVFLDHETADKIAARYNACEGFESDILDGAEPGLLFRMFTQKEAKIQELEKRVLELEKLLTKRSKVK